MKILSLFAIALLLALLVNGCVPTEEGNNIDFVEFSELTSHPAEYDGRNICTEGVYAHAFECNALAESTYRKGAAVYLTQPAIWIQGATIVSSTDCFTTDTFPPAEFCKVRICGLFEYGDAYGHAGGYEYQIRGHIEEF